MIPPQLPFVTSFYAGLLGLFALVLAGLVIRARTRNRISVGDDDNPDMIRIMRVHANFTEFVPLALLLIALGEIMAEPRWIVHAECLALVIARVLHAYGLGASDKANPGRFLGALVTFIVIAVASIALIARTALQIF